LTFVYGTVCLSSFC